MWNRKLVISISVIVTAAAQKSEADFNDEWSPFEFPDNVKEFAR